jgi:hypothetical protein
MGNKEEIMTEYNRYMEQCHRCGCYYENLPPENLKELEEMLGEEFQAECTLEQDCWAGEPCQFFSKD